MQRYTRIIGHIMKARAFPQQKTEAWISESTPTERAEINQTRDADVCQNPEKKQD